MSKLHDSLWVIANIAFLTALLVPVTWISSAYAGQLNAIGVVTPVGAFQPSFATGEPLGHIVHASTQGDFKSQFRQINFDAKLVRNSETFMVRWLDTVKNNKTNLLWSSYPASIRGQVFNNKPAGGDPFVSGGW